MRTAQLKQHIRRHPLADGALLITVGFVTTQVPVIVLGKGFARSALDGVLPFLATVIGILLSMIGVAIMTAGIIIAGCWVYWRNN